MMHVERPTGTGGKQRTCPKCRRTKPAVDFYYRKTESRYNPWCKACVCDFQVRRWKDRKRQAVELLGGKCSRCGYAKNLSAFHFHHVDRSTKDCNWNQLRLRSWRRIVEELKKCVLVCANCHAEIHSPEDDVLAPVGRANARLDRVDPAQTGVCTCGAPVYGTKYCSVGCAGVARRHPNRPSRDVLQKLLAVSSRAAVARGFGVSETAVRKWEKAYVIRSERKTNVKSSERTLFKH